MAWKALLRMGPLRTLHFILFQQKTQSIDMWEGCRTSWCISFVVCFHSVCLLGKWRQLKFPNDLHHLNTEKQDKGSQRLIISKRYRAHMDIAEEKVKCILLNQAPRSLAEIVWIVLISTFLRYLGKLFFPLMFPTPEIWVCIWSFLCLVFQKPRGVSNSCEHHWALWRGKWCRKLS